MNLDSCDVSFLMFLHIHIFHDQNRFQLPHKSIYHFCCELSSFHTSSPGIVCSYVDQVF